MNLFNEMASGKYLFFDFSRKRGKYTEELISKQVIQTIK